MNSESFKAYIVVENRDQNSVTELGRGNWFETKIRVLL